MDDLNEQIADLTSQLHALRTAQLQLNGELARIEQQLTRLKANLPANTHMLPNPATIFPATQQPSVPQKRIIPQGNDNRRSIEDFIGANLISKIGILITIIGIFIGAKYAIDKELMSPLMRIISGYACAGVLIGTGLWLKRTYLQFSAVLVGGGTAVAYFITYTAHTFYNLFPQPVAFLLMLLTTAGAVALALWYNQKIIAMLGQIAAYAIPLLLSDGSGKLAVLFTYIAIINTGLIVLAFKKQWKLLYHTAFIITWVMYFLCLIVQNGGQLSFAAGMLFLSINFMTFYITFLAYKIFKQELYKLGEIVVLLLNALIFFLIGYRVVDRYFHSVNALTLFTICNAIVHFAVGYGIFKAKLADRSVEQFLIGLGLLFLSVAIPVKLDGNWVTFLWTVETIILVVIAIRTNRHLYFEIALTVMVVALLSLLQDRTEDYLQGRLLWSKYISLFGVALAWIALNKGRKTFPFDNQGSAVFAGIFNITLLGCIGSEYLFWLNRAGYENQYKLGLTLIGGSYALIMLFIGLIRNLKYLRVGAMGLFSITIGKLFFYDLAAMTTITKTVVMVALGVLLLFASFLYHKYKAVLQPEEKQENEQNEQGA